jgi:hypothetical protein
VSSSSSSPPASPTSLTSPSTEGCATGDCD